jgi:hypothetical protein
LFTDARAVNARASPTTPTWWRCVPDDDHAGRAGSGRRLWDIIRIRRRREPITIIGGGRDLFLA